MKRKKEKKFNKTQYPKATINDYGSDGYTAVGRACKNNDLRTVKTLLTKFPEIDLSKGRKNFLKEEWKLSVLDIAQSNQNHKMIKLLALHSSDSLRHNEENIPTMHATGLTEILMNQGFDAFIDKIDGMSTAYEKGVTRALKSSIRDQIETTISSLSKSVSYARNQIPEKHELLTAIRASNVEAIKIIVHNIPTLIDHANSLNQTSLHYAARLGKNKILEFLITNSKQLNPLDIKGFTPLDYALKGGQVSTVVVLLKHGITHSKLQNDYQQALTNNNVKKLHKLE